MAAPDVSQIDFTIAYNGDNTPKDITLTDTTNVPGIGGGITDPDITSIIKGEMPDGSVFYEGNFGAPDIVHPGDLTETFSPTLDADGDYIQGTYVYTYTTRLIQAEFNLAVIAFDDVAGYLDVNEDVKWAVDQHLDKAFDVVPSAGAPFTIQPTSSVTLSGGGTRINFTPVTWTGTGPFALSFTEDVDYVIARELDLTYTEPDICIDQSFSCNESTFTSTDSTTYPSGATVVRTHTVRWPQDIQPSPPADTVSADAIVILGPNIYTGNYNSQVSSVVAYNFGNGFTLVQTFLGADNKEVSCTALHCQILCGIKEFNTQYKAKQDAGTLTFVDLANANYLNLLIQEYNSEVACGNSAAAETVADTIKTFLDGCGCDCADCGDTGCSDDVAQEIIPISVAAGVVLVYTLPNIFTQAGAPGAGLGDDGNLYINITNWDLYKKVAGTWVLQGNIKGAAGATGAAGSNGANGSNGADGVDAYIYVGYSDDGLSPSFSLTQTPTTQFINFITSSVPLTPVYADFTGPWLQYVYPIGSINDHSDVSLTTTVPPLLDNGHMYISGNNVVTSPEGWNQFEGTVAGPTGAIGVTNVGAPNWLVAYYTTKMMPKMLLRGTFTVASAKVANDVLWTIPNVKATSNARFWVQNQNVIEYDMYLLEAFAKPGPGYGIEIRALSAMPSPTYQFSLDGFELSID